MPRRSLVSAAAAATLLLSAPIAAQIPQPGVESGWRADLLWSVQGLDLFSVRGFAAAPALDLPGARDERLWVAVANRIEEIDLGSSSPPRILHLFPHNGTVGWIGWVPSDNPTRTDRGRLVYTRLSPPEIVSMNPFAPDPRTTVRFGQLPANTFDIAVSDTGRMIASSDPGFPSPGSTPGLWLLDPTFASAPRLIVQVTGPSGPLAFDDNGDLLYAVQTTAFPPPPGATQIVRFPAATLDQLAVAGTPAGSLNDAVPDGAVDSAYDMVGCDRDSWLVSESAFGEVRRIGPGRSAQPVLLANAVHGTSLQLQWADDPTIGPHVFEPHQPTYGGGSLFAQTSDFQTHTAIWRIRPRRPEVVVTPSGTIFGPATMTWTTQGFPPGSPIALGLATSTIDPETPLLFDGDVPLWLDTFLPTVVMLPAVYTAPGAMVSVQVPAGLNVDLGALAFGVGTLPSGQPHLISTATTPFSLR